MQVAIVLGIIALCVFILLVILCLILLAVNVVNLVVEGWVDVAYEQARYKNIRSFYPDK